MWFCRRLEADGSFQISEREGSTTRRSLTGRWWCEELEVVKVMFAVKPDGERKEPLRLGVVHVMIGSGWGSMLRSVWAFGCVGHDGTAGHHTEW